MKRMGGLVLGAALLFVGCTKKQEYDTLYKENVHSKSIIDTRANFLYVPTAAEGDRNASGGRPYWVGEQKMVRFQWLEHELRIVQVEPDDRYRDNPTNIKTIMSIPVEHHEYQCKKDQNGECTNQEEENEEVDFNRKGNFKPDFSAAKITEINLMPIELDNIFDGGCYTETASRLIGYNLSEEGLLLQIERDYTTSAKCAQIFELEDLFNMTFSARFTYSVVRLDRLNSKDYKPLVYDGTEENTFGFFTTVLRRLAADNRDMVEGETTFLNRWSPNRKEIVYNLSPAFAKPENRVVLEATNAALAKMNDTLEAAGVGFRIKAQMPSGQVPGDLRHSEIVLIEDPLKVGLLGYGPSITDPYTGEIVYARVAMYLGVVKQFIWREYDRLVEQELAKKVKASNLTQVTLHPDLQKLLRPVKTDEAPASAPQSLELAKSIHSRLFGPAKTPGFFDPAKVRQIESAVKRMGYMTDESMAQLTRFIKNPTDREFRDMEINKPAHLASLREKLTKMDQVSAIALTGAYPAELFNFQAAVQQKAKDIIGDDPKPWIELSEAEREAVLEKMIPVIWIPTLIHEVGHTLGLRHNFAGSEDKDNFYSKEELAKLGASTEIAGAEKANPIPYSSMMDYAYSDLNGLPVMGKYDLAALRFGYNRQLDLNTTEKDGVRVGPEIKVGGAVLKRLDGSVRLHQTRVTLGGDIVDDKGTAVLINLKTKKIVDVKADVDANGNTVYTNVEGLSQDESGKPVIVAVKWPSSLGQVDEALLKPYKFCTDENVDANPNCNRFDEGTTLVEMTEHIIKAADESYKRSNFKAGRRFFSAMRDLDAIARSDYTMFQFRILFERYALFQKEFDLQPAHWESIAFLKEVNDAAKIGAEYILRSLLTHDTICAVADEKNPTQILGLLDLRDTPLGGKVQDCFDPGVIIPYDGIVAVGQAGRSVINRKSTTNPNAYADQIDVRGIYGDKMVALEYLLQRRLGSSLFDDSESFNFLQHHEIRPILLDVLEQILLDQVESEVAIEIPSTGQVISGLWKASWEKTHVLPEPMDDRVSKIFNLHGNKHIASVVSERLKELIPDQSDLASSSQDLERFSIYTAIPSGANPAKFEGVVIGGTHLFATEKNIVAKKAMSGMRINQVLGALSDAQIEKIMDLLADPAADTSKLTPAEKAGYDLGADAVASYLEGGTATSKYLLNLLLTLPRI